MVKDKVFWILILLSNYNLTLLKFFYLKSHEKPIDMDI